MTDITPDKIDNILQSLKRIAYALEEQAGLREPERTSFEAASAFVWDAGNKRLDPVYNTKALPYDMLVGIDDHIQTLHQNTQSFAKGFPANNALLWGARGTGKSSLVKSVHKELSKDHPLILIEIHREDIASISTLLKILDSETEKQFILFCDDLSFDEQDSSYKSLKAVLEGGIQSRPDNVIFYATSNRRHLIPRDMIENERRSAIHGGEAVEEKVSLSDRFGLWLGFYPCEQDEYFEMVERYAKAYKLKIKKDDLLARALEWSMLRGARSGRVAWQFIQGLSGELGVKI
jgi:predicted AAA+ superfamily ATPase